MEQSADKQWYCRLKIIDLSGQGFAVGQLVVMFGLSQHTIRSYIHRYNLNGLAGRPPDYGQRRASAIDWDKEQWLEL